MKPLRFTVALLALLLGWGTAPAQQLQGAHWFFGTRVGIDFTRGAPRFEHGSQINDPSSTASSVSNAAGRLLFYANQTTAWDRRHQVMPGAAGLGIPGTGGGASTLAAPQPGNANRHYLFQANNIFGPSPRDRASAPFGYSILDMSLNGGYGDVVPGTGGTVLHTGVARMLTAVPHTNGQDTWIITHAAIGNGFYAWLLSAQGLNAQPVISQVGIAFDSVGTQTNPNEEYLGMIKASPSGNSLALLIEYSGLVQVFDFDRSTGTVSLPKLYIRADSVSWSDTIFLGASFSSDSRFLYLSALNAGIFQVTPPTSRLYQFDLSLPDSTQMLASKTKVFDSQSILARALQLGPDGRLYFTADSAINTFGGTQSLLNVIECPNEPGTACRARVGAVRFPVPSAAYVPPALNETFFRNAGILQVVADEPNPCRGDTVTLTAFGAGTTGFTWAPGFGVPVGATGAVVQFVPDSARTYLVDATRPCGGPLTAQVLITPQDYPPVPVISNSGGVLSTTAPGPYQWLLNGAPIAGATQGSYTPLQPGTYTVVVGARCITQSVDLLITGLAEDAASFALSVFPVPADQELFIMRDTLISHGLVRLRDPLGRVVRAAVWTGSRLRLDTSTLPPGMYLLEAASDLGGNPLRRRILIQH